MHVNNCGCQNEPVRNACRFVWLNQYADQFLPILALIALRIIVGVGDSFLKVVTRPKKDPMQARPWPCAPPVKTP